MGPGLTFTGDPGGRPDPRLAGTGHGGADARSLARNRRIYDFDFVRGYTSHAEFVTSGNLLTSLR